MVSIQEKEVLRLIEHGEYQRQSDLSAAELESAKKNLIPELNTKYGNALFSLVGNSHIDSRTGVLELSGRNLITRSSAVEKKHALPLLFSDGIISFLNTLKFEASPAARCYEISLTPNFGTPIDQWRDRLTVLEANTPDRPETHRFVVRIEHRDPNAKVEERLDLASWSGREYSPSLVSYRRNDGSVGGGISVDTELCSFLPFDVFGKIITELAAHIPTPRAV